VSIDAGFLYAVAFPLHHVRVAPAARADVARRLFGAAELSVSYFWRDRWQFFGGVTAIRSTTYRVSLGFIVPALTLIRPRVGAAYRTGRQSYVEAAASTMLNDYLSTLPEPFTQYQVGFTHLF
jgi:hypothetical protein